LIRRWESRKSLIPSATDLLRAKPYEIICILPKASHLRPKEILCVPNRALHLLYPNAPTCSNCALRYCSGMEEWVVTRSPQPSAHTRLQPPSLSCIWRCETTQQPVRSAQELKMRDHVKVNGFKSGQLASIKKVEAAKKRFMRRGSSALAATNDMAAA
jgi:hypothetical protein